MDIILAIINLTEKIALSYPLGPIIILASLYFIYDGYENTSSVQIFFAALALIWTSFTLYVALVH
ncbi:MAG: hypothetical protein HY525_15880 [Betaproteobacteria bacterium]|nr:hypothetical protein [Betaproteobacteria bacterium]